MNVQAIKIGLGGGCHWCTEGVFQSLKGVHKVEQGWIASIHEHHTFSEAIIVHFNPDEISLAILIEIHLHTHSSTSNHSMRKKYRSAVYTFSEAQHQEAQSIISELQADFERKIVTKVYPFNAFKENIEEQLNYFYSDPTKAFCERYIHPKLQLLMQQYNKHVAKDKLEVLREKGISL